MTKNLTKWGIGLGLLSNALPALSQQDRLFELSLQELLEVPVNTASVQALPVRRQPATMSLITRQDINRWGARNLADILSRIPGVSFGADVFGVNSLIFRGQWAHEGKILLLWDDLPLDDMMFGNLNTAEHFPASQIDRVEVLRGAGSASYGGNAQLAVIRVYSRANSGTNGSVNISADKMQSASVGYTAATNINFQRGELQMSTNLHLASEPYTNQRWFDSEGDSYNLADYSGNDTYNVALKADWRDLHFRFLHDSHDSESPQKFGQFTPGESVNFTSTNWSLSYDWQVAENLRITPTYIRREQSDWFINRDRSKTPFLDYQLPADRDTAKIEGYWSTESIDLLVGSEYWKETGYAKSPGGPVQPANDVNTYFGGSRSVDYSGTSLYSQMDWHLGDWLASLGARYSDHSYAGDSLVPRVVGVYTQPDWHLKLTYGQAFREPDIETINGGDPDSGPIRPEQSTQSEIEIGRRISPNWYATAAIFNVKVDDPTLYSSSTDTNLFAYRNNESTATQGMEMEWRGDYERTKAYLSYSYYQVSGEAIEPYRVAHDGKKHLAAPQHKLSLNTEYAISNEWQLLANWTFYSDFYAKSNVSGELQQSQFDAQNLVNLLLRYKVNSWRFTAGVYDILDDGLLLGQPYDSDSSAYPSGGRRFWLATEWSWE